MKINNIQTPVVSAVNKISKAAENLKPKNNAIIGESGLPLELPLDLFNDKKAAAYLQESWGFDRAKDAVNIFCLKLQHK